MHARNLEAYHLQQARVIHIATIADLVEVLASKLLLEHQRYGRHPVHNVGHNQENADKGRGYKNAFFAVRKFPDHDTQAKRQERTNQEPDEPDAVNQVRNGEIHEHGAQQAEERQAYSKAFVLLLQKFVTHQENRK